MIGKYSKLKQDYLIAQKEAVRLSFERCNFNDECDYCKSPSLGSYAYGGHGDEVDGYRCGRCILLMRKNTKL